MSIDQVNQFAIKPASVALVAGAAATAWRPGTNVLISGRVLPLGVVVAGASFIASEVAEMVNSYVNSHIPSMSLLSHPVHTAASIGTQAAAVCAIDNYFSPGLIQDQGLGEIVALAALGEVAGSYLAKEWLQPWYQQMAGKDSY